MTAHIDIVRMADQVADILGEYEADHPNDPQFQNALNLLAAASIRLRDLARVDADRANCAGISTPDPDPMTDMHPAGGTKSQG